jgi:hypothetical protein
LAQADAEQGRLDDERLENIFKTVSDVVEDLAEHGDSDTAPAAKAKGRASANRKVVPLASGDFGKPVFCAAGLGRLDDCAVLIVADALKREGINARVAGATTAIEDDNAASICLCYLENVSKARLDYAVRKLSRKAGAARIVVCLLTDAKQISSGSEQGDEPPRSLKATVAAFASPNTRSESVVGN